MFHGWACKLEPAIWLIVRQAVIEELAAEYEQAQAEHRENVARAARSN
jgi:hypothetical protein